MYCIFTVTSALSLTHLQLKTKPVIRKASQKILNLRASLDIELSASIQKYGAHITRH